MTTTHLKNSRTPALRAGAASAWDGRSRAPLRIGLAIVAGLDLISLARDLHHLVPGPASHPLAPAWLLGLGSHPLAIWAFAAMGVGALIMFGAGRAPLRAGALALAVLALFAESEAAAVGGPHRNFFAAGAVLLGWLGGVAWGRGLGGANREDLAEAGGLAALAATYVGAAASKLVERGLGWADALTLRDLLLSQQRVSDHGLGARLVAFIVERPAICQALALAALATQLGALSMLVSRSLRVVVGGLLVGFHLQVALLTGIFYGGNVRLLMLFCLPWPRLWPASRALARLPAPSAPPAPDPVVERRVAVAALAMLVTAIGLAWLSPIRDYTLLHGRP